MTLKQRWMRRPHSVWLRKALFQIHLWTGIAIGLYLVVISISGSAIVFRNELYTSLGQKPIIVEATGVRMTLADLKKSAVAGNPGYEVSYVWESKNPRQAVELWLDRGSDKRQHLFNPYTGADLGPSVPLAIRVLSWLKDLHISLLAGDTGKVVNGIGAILLTLLAITGAVIWWPGIRGWKRALIIHHKSGWKRINWDLHSAVGFWTLGFVFMWGVVGTYSVFPLPFQKLVNRFAPLYQYRFEFPDASIEQAPAAPTKFLLVADESPRPKGKRAPRRYSFGDMIIRWFSWLHFGNFAGWRTKALWTIMGFVPPFLFVTGAIMWWNRVLSPAARRSRRRTQAVMTAAAHLADL